MAAKQDNGSEEIFGSTLDKSDESDSVEEPVSTDRPDESSKGAALSGSRHTLKRGETITSETPGSSSRDLDADWSDTTGEETSLGTVETPDQDQVDEIAAPWGIGSKPDEELNVGKKVKRLETERQRDEVENLRNEK